VILSGCGIYKPLLEFSGAGASVPLTGFGHCLAEGVKSAIEEKGFLGILTGGLQATAGGISAAILAGLIVSLLFKAKDKA
jgi:stage V sporulation protein AE